MVKLVATDIDGTFLRSDDTFDAERFKKILSRMKELDCNFVVASGNYYYKLRKMFADYGDEISFVSDNGAYVELRGELIFTADIPKATVAYVAEVCKNFPDISVFLCGVKSAYTQRGLVKQKDFDFITAHMPGLHLVENFKDVDDQFLKMCVMVENEKIDDCYKFLRANLQDKLSVITSGFCTIDLILPGCHKASGIKKIAERLKISPAECVAFGDSENDIEMLKYCGQSYAMKNAADIVKAAAKNICPPNDEDGVFVTLEKILQ